MRLNEVQHKDIAPIQPKGNEYKKHRHEIIVTRQRMHKSLKSITIPWSVIKHALIIVGPLMET